MIYTAQEIKQADDNALRMGMPSEVLMERAASAVASQIKLKPSSTVLVICGVGNNGGDGWVIARELAQKGHEVTVWTPLGNPRSEEGKLHASYAKQFVKVVTEPQDADYFIDALLGIGLQGPVEGKAREVITWIRDQDKPVLSIDIPSGIPSDHAGQFDGHAVSAETTFTLHGYKRSAFLNKTAPYYGDIERIDIGLPHCSEWRILTEADFDHNLLSRDVYGHKNLYGHGQLIGGSSHLLGAPFLAAKSALRTGIGLLDLAVPKEAMVMAGSLPEAMYYSIDDLPDSSYGAVAIGPGMVEDERMEKVWDTIKRNETPTIVDAGALSPNRLTSSGPLILTPHPGEFARVSGHSVSHIEADRFGVASAFAKEHGVHLILKGTHTLIVSPDGTGAVNTIKAPALSKGGSGDVLTGMLLALWARTDRIEPTKNPNEQAVLWHALAAKKASERLHLASVMASDVIEAIGQR